MFKKRKNLAISNQTSEMGEAQRL